MKRETYNEMPSDTWDVCPYVRAFELAYIEYARYAYSSLLFIYPSFFRRFFRRFFLVDSFSSFFIFLNDSKRKERWFVRKLSVSYLKEE